MPGTEMQAKFSRHSFRDLSTLDHLKIGLGGEIVSLDAIQKFVSKLETPTPSHKHGCHLRHAIKNSEPAILYVGISSAILGLQPYFNVHLSQWTRESLLLVSCLDRHTTRMGTSV